VELTAALAADLAILSEALDETHADIVEELGQFVADAKVAVRSYLGLTVTAGNSAFPLTFTVMEHLARPDDVRTSLMMPLSDNAAAAPGRELAVILYAAVPGAFVDLAADLCWLTGRRPSDYALDQHLRLPAQPDPDSGVLTASLVGQAVGVLLGRGYTPEQAMVEIDARATAAGHSRSDAAGIILADPLA
jgi:hypothetical protein